MDKLPSIQSIQNSMVKHAHSLTIPKKLGESLDFLCEGFHLVREAFKSSLKVRYLLASKRALVKSEGEEVVRMARGAKVRVFEVPDKIIGFLSETAAPQGLVAVAAKPTTRKPENVGCCVLALDAVQDPGNVGTLFRSAEAFGADGLLLTEGCCDPFNPKAVRAAMGSLFRVPYEYGLDWRTAMAWALEKGLTTVALVPTAASSILEVPSDRPVMFWAGSESQGLKADLADACSMKAAIPMRGFVESLNVGVSGSLALFYKGFGRAVP